MIRAELMKLTTVGATKVAAAVGIIGLLATQLLFFWLLPALASGAIAITGEPGIAAELGEFDPGSFAFQYSSLSLLGSNAGAGSIGVALIAVLSIGVLAATTDYRFGGIVAAALASPRRARILGGKVAATAVVVAVMAVAYAVVCLGVLLSSTTLSGVDLVVGWGDIAGAIGRGVVVLVLLGLLGLAIGVLVRSQLAGFLVLIGVVLVEPILQSVLLLVGEAPAWSQYLPLALAQAGLADPASPAALSPLVALVALAALAGVALAAAWAVLRRRDL
ncbi:MAG TPA: hypothetical protein VFG92_00750 [Agromyces sp.]|nr:hypothetical protein [Agromyces sp.]